MRTMFCVNVVKTIGRARREINTSAAIVHKNTGEGRGREEGAKTFLILPLATFQEIA